MTRKSESAPEELAVDDVVFRPVRPGRVCEETVQRLTAAMTLGVIPFGGQLPPERELAPRLGVSRTALREAIRILEEQGLVEVRVGRSGGTFVAHQSTLPRAEQASAHVREMGADLDDILEFRAVLEPAAAEMAARRASPAAAERLRGFLVGVGHTSLAEYRIADARFHLAIAELAGVPSLAAAIADVEVRIAAPIALLPPWGEALERSDREHLAIVEAISANDTHQAREVMTEHLGATAQLLRDLRLA